MQLTRFTELLVLAACYCLAMDTCIICHKEVKAVSRTVLSEKGAEGIRNASKERNEALSCNTGDVVHKNCRRDFTDKRRILTAKRHFSGQQNTNQPELRSSSTFDYKSHCLFCSKGAKYNKLKRGYDVFAVRTIEFQKTILQICERRNDSWGDQVKGRINAVNDLHAADCIYHQTCNVSFRTMKNMPVLRSLNEPTPKKNCMLGRPAEENRLQAFQKTIQFLEENDDEQITISDLVRKMSEFCDEPFSAVYMKKKILEKYGDNIIITSINGKPDVVTLRYTARYILHNFFETSSNGVYRDKDAVIKAAANIIRSDIKAMETSKQAYPTATSVQSLSSNLDYLPSSITSLLRTVFTEKKADLKIAAIGQAIVQAVRPRVVIAPLQLSLSVQLHHHFSSRYLIDTLFNLGFCSSYNEVQKFELCAAAVEGKTDLNISQDSCLQFIADNVDHNSNTLDGHNTFHGMGIMATSTPATKTVKEIPRMDIHKDSIMKFGTIEVSYYRKRNHTPAILFTELEELKYTDRYWQLDLLSSIIWPLKSPRPAWSGFMQMIHKAEHPGESSMHFFPMIDLEPGDMSCVYSTLKFVCKEAEKYSKCPIITFDQPLYWKALLIIRHEMEDSTLSKIVLRLGGFHLQMSFLGSIGFLMSGSGLEELLGTTYAPNAVKHMLSGKAVSRAVRGHFLVESALNSMLVRKVFVQEDGISDTTESPVSDAEVCSLGTIHNDLKTACKIYEDLITGKANLDCVIDDNVFERIHTAMSKYEIEVSECKTARMWFTYLRMVSLLHSFIRAERMGDWHLHLDTVQRMLPYFAASGHNLYLKSAYVYLTDMQQLPITHPETYHAFVSGKHVIRRSDRFWAGIWTDLTIEQVLMRSLKSTGGLTRGRGMTDFQRAVWILSSPVCAEMSMAMQELTHIQYTSSDQHKEASTSRQARDEKDLTTTSNFLIDRDPFNSDMKELRNIDNGVTAEENVNVADCLEIGNTIIESMKGSDAMSYVFRRKNKVVTLAASNSFRVDDESISVDPQLMFQRLSSIARDTSSDLSDVFKYELSGVPSALFDNSGLLREAQKSQLADAIWSFGDCGVDSIDSCSSFVIDGGSLLHRLTWPQNATYGSIITMYTHYISSRYKNPCIIFDGYSETPSMKDVAHLRRSKGMLWRKVIFNDSTVCSMKKEAFLTNKDNKKRFIDLLTIHLRDSDCEVLQAQGDADYMLAMKTIEKAASGNVALIGEDTDLLILLLHHLTQNLEHDIYFYSDKQTKNDLKIWDLRKTRSALGVDVCSCLAFLHALTGCDTTSRIYGIGKHQALKKTVSHISMVKKAAELFGRRDAARTELEMIGEEVIGLLYGALPGEGLDVLRFRKFITKMSTLNKQVDVQTLPPTFDSSKQHIYRTYCQVQQWNDNELDPLQWGWKVDGNNRLQPVKMCLPPAPSNLLKIIRCNCKTHCDTKRCSCRKHGISCSICCGECRGVSCSNSEIIDNDND